MKNLMSLSLLLIALLFNSCSNNDQEDYVPIEEDSSSEINLPDVFFNYANIVLPEHYTENSFPDQFQFQAAIEFDNTPIDNPITDAGATLGRVLFYDEKLSANGTVSCASCHKAEHGFSDPDILSKGFEGGLTRRHSMGIVNARFYEGGKFFWDERAATLEEQVLMPFQDEVEMGLTLQELTNIVAEQTYYWSLFADAFGDQNITSDRISRALAQFIRSLVSTTSKYDQARSDVDSPIVDFPNFTEQENEGKRLFYMPRPLTNGLNANCVACHVSEAFVAPIPTVTPIPSGITTFATTNGLDAISTTDLGVNETTANPNDIGKFKVPSLKNIAIRPPYMHDGRFATLEEVIEHYSSGIQNHQSLISPLVNSEGQVGQFNFTEEEKEALIAFLNTLTDNQMLTDEKYSNPFE
ncbi:cytochrome-c peroxidase [Aquimarina sp. AD1]|uniref:cytochrome-c peroxidase n=1 Tax=Aquimarina sp. (strain AD1) TaxID=1714848 RepID=UPI000E528252|nr:cytochrome c peroxidase [Aquimarina sp. AD1]AXT54483.1 cytochrome-c peroxidase [Aquimarina sp. AD1]RKN03139.1 cytochrome-c peroxidase [Aquimarina sp. AD1]